MADKYKQRIEFRYWTPTLKMFRTPQFVSGDGLQMLTLMGKQVMIENNPELEMWCGSLDCNDTKVFEGDIVKVMWDYNDDPQSMSDLQWSKSTYTVVWLASEHKFGIQSNNPRDSKAVLHIPHNKHDIRIVGHIHET